ncbi:MAG: TonB-dependent receptor [Hyphomicrobiaceae bacterium]|nr:TonB-dependent receptor [Hyphomicrobiaceae bacterium]
MTRFFNSSSLHLRAGALGAGSVRGLAVTGLGCTALALLLADTAAAQTVGAVELPPVVVQGATLAKPKIAPKKRPNVADNSGESSDAASVKKKRAKSKSGGDSGAVASKTPVTPPPPVPAADLDLNADASGGAAQTDGERVGVRADTVGTALTVVGSDQIEAAQERTGTDVLRSLPGVSISQQGGAGSVAVARIRGAESNHTLVLIDGVEVNSSIDGFYDFSNLATDDIERVEVLRGPQSGLYGSGALGGVINIVTKSGKGPLTLTAEGEAGSFNTKGGRVGISGGTDSIWGSFTASSRTTDGIDISPIGHERDGSKLQTLSLKGGVRPFENLTISGSFRASQLDSDYDNFSSFLPGYQMAIDAPNTSSNDMWSGRIQAELSLMDDAWTQQIFAARSKRDFFDVSFPEWFPVATPNHLIDQTSTYGYKTTLRVGPKSGGPVRHFVTGLVEQREENFDQPTSGDFHAERGRTSFAGEVRGEYFETLFLGASVRRDLNDTFEDTTDWRVDGSLKVPQSPFRLHASYGTGTKLPSFAELYGTFLRYTPNPDLAPERSKGWDTGVETTFLGGRGILDVTYFKADLENEITEDYSQGVNNIRSVNLDGRSQRQGVEVSGRLKVTAGVTLGASYTWLDARDDNDEREVRRPEHQARFDVDWRSGDGRARLNLATIYNGRMADIAFLDAFPYSERLYLDDYWLVRLAGSYEVAPGLEMFGRVENLLNENYQEVFGYETAGVAAYAGLRLRLEAGRAPIQSWK